jgi:hypothetical protein
MAINVSNERRWYICHVVVVRVKVRAKVRAKASNRNYES